MRSAALWVVAIASVAAEGCASPCVDDRCSVKSPPDVAARKHQANMDIQPALAASPAAAEPAATAEPTASTEPAGAPWGARFGGQRGVLYAGGQLTIRYTVRANQSDPSLADIAFTYVNQSPNVAVVQFTVQGRDDSGKDLWTRRVATGRLNAAASAVATVTTAASSFPLSISVADVKLCPIGADDSMSTSTSVFACAQVEPATGDPARLQRPAT